MGWAAVSTCMSTHSAGWAKMHDIKRNVHDQSMTRYGTGHPEGRAAMIHRHITDITGMSRRPWVGEVSQCSSSGTKAVSHGMDITQQKRTIHHNELNLFENHGEWNKIYDVTWYVAQPCVQPTQLLCARVQPTLYADMLCVQPSQHVVLAA